MPTEKELLMPTVIGKEIISAVELIRDQIPKLEKEVKTCDVDSLRLIRSATLNNCRSRVAGNINLDIFTNNQKRISEALEKFTDKCVCKKFSQ